MLAHCWEGAIYLFKISLTGAAAYLLWIFSARFAKMGAILVGCCCLIFLGMDISNLVVIIRTMFEKATVTITTL
jgi:hypothetical protein